MQANGHLEDVLAQVLSKPDWRATVLVHRLTIGDHRHPTRSDLWAADGGSGDSGRRGYVIAVVIGVF